MKSLFVVLGLLLAMVPAAARRVSVSVGDFSFSPSSVDVNMGDSVEWTNHSTYYVHTSTSGTNGTPDGNWDSGDIGIGRNFTHAFTSGGTFPYFCRYHYAMGMTGSVIVAGTGIAADAPRPARTALACRPNPFRSSTTLLRSGRSLPVRIYDVSGLLVRELAREPLNWDGRDAGGRMLPAGVYHCVSGRATIVLTKLD